MPKSRRRFCVSQPRIRSSRGDGWKVCYVPYTFPTRHARAPESDVLRQDVRRMLYQNGRAIYRVLFALGDADGDGEPDTVRVLRVLHGAQRPLGAEDEEEV